MMDVIEDREVWRLNLEEEHQVVVLKNLNMEIKLTELQLKNGSLQLQPLQKNSGSLGRQMLNLYRKQRYSYRKKL